MQQTINQQRDPSLIPRAHTVVIDQQLGESDEFYARRMNDPLEVAFADETTRRKLMGQSMNAIRHGLQDKKPHEVVESATDVAFRSFGISGSSEIKGAVRLASDTIKQELAKDNSPTPTEKLGLQSRQLDLLSLNIFDKYRSQHGEADSAENSHISTMLEAVCRDVIKQGGQLLKEAQRLYETIPDSEERKSFRGKMFELLYITFMRLEAYSAEEHDERIILGATEFEDSAARLFKPMNHNYDVIVLDADGNTQELIQCKTAQSDMGYERPIHKVTGKAFSRFIADPHTFVTAVVQLASNSADVSEERMQSNQALLDSLFDERQRTGSQFRGKVALAGTFVSH